MSENFHLAWLLGFLASWTLMSSLLGGLGARVDLLKQNFTLSMIGAATGVLFPIGLSYLLLYLGFRYGWFICPNSYSQQLTWTRCG